MGAWIGGIVEAKAARRASNMQRDANSELTKRMEQARQATVARRPELNSQKWNAMQQQLSMFQPSIGLLSEATGGKYAPDLSKLSNPVNFKANQYDLSAGDPYQRSLKDMPSEDQATALRRMQDAGYDTTDMERTVRQNTTAERARLAAAAAKNPPKPTSVAAEYDRRYGSKK